MLVDSNQSCLCYQAKNSSITSNLGLFRTQTFTGAEV